MLAPPFNKQKRTGIHGHESRLFLQAHGQPVKILRWRQAINNAEYSSKKAKITTRLVFGTLSGFYSEKTGNKLFVTGLVEIIRLSENDHC